MKRKNYQLKIGKTKIRLGERTLVMGILNVTPDSFSDGGRFLNHRDAIEHGTELVKAGADWLDVGGESTRPGAKPVSVKEELRRVLPVVQGLSRRLPRTVISIDTTKAEVAEAALAHGASIINDVSGLRYDKRLAEIAARHRAGLILMHMRGQPQTMQQRPFARDIWKSLREGLERSIHSALDAGVYRSQILIDPGLGFGKSRQQNYEILADLKRLKDFHLPVLIGSSRKSFVRAALADNSPNPNQQSRGAKRAGGGKQNFEPTAIHAADAAAIVAAILGGAHVVRVHDVAALAPAVRLADWILAGKRKSA